MPRPDSHRPLQPDKSCATCAFSRLVSYKLDLLCFHGDNIEIQGTSRHFVEADNVLLDGEEVGLMDGDEYARVWSKRIVEPDDICDEWKLFDSSSDQ